MNEITHSAAPVAGAGPAYAEASSIARHAFAYVQAAGLRITPQRSALLKVLILHPEPRPLAEIHNDIVPPCDEASVYRSLDAFAEIGLVRRLFSFSGIVLFNLETEPERYRVIARDPRATVFDDVIPSPEMRIAVQRVEDALRALGYREVGHVVQFFSDGMPFCGNPGPTQGPDPSPRS